MKSQNPNQKILKKIINTQITRVGATQKSHLWFFHTYLSDFVQYRIAGFHREIFKITEDENAKLAAFCSFRGSGKSTLLTLSFPIWAILGRLQKKFVVIISQTADQAKLHFKNLRRELETNELLKRDLGPFQEQDEWNNSSLIIPKFNAKIIAVSKDMSFRGVRHGRYRPDLIIADDVENSDSVKTQESRDALYNWFTSEVLPLGDKNTKVVVVGNLLHQDSLLKRLEADILDKKRVGIFKQYSIIDEDTNKISWPGKYPGLEDIEEEKLRVGNIFAWYREYLLRIVDEREPVVNKSQIHYYDQLPEILRNQGYSFATGVDLAMSEKETADFTTLVTAKVIGSGKDMKIYILPNPTNKRLPFSEIIHHAENICRVHEGRFSNKFYIEDVMLQGYMTQQLKERGIEAIGVSVRGKDKRTRLELSTPMIYEGKVLFPKHGCDELLNQVLNFGVTKHDDLTDGLTTLLLGMSENPPNNTQQVMFIEHNFYDRGPKISRSHGWGPGISSSIELNGDEFFRRY